MIKKFGIKWFTGVLTSISIFLPILLMEITNHRQVLNVNQNITTIEYNWVKNTVFSFIGQRPFSEKEHRFPQNVTSLFEFLLKAIELSSNMPRFLWCLQDGH